ncbi:phosphoenolpyruvate--protein phosphotransferase [uncultured Bartonella sp.]|uniref:phosphoenolpyruvate--protein phosphotransferase n=1 Tax=uncultured Bartonella sp. TaxID=104108 RepID=UPI00261A03B1|nr:phosphoenolpyruvate--protein phosphotransferase [uncultured Bartonella sp.]
MAVNAEKTPILSEKAISLGTNFADKEAAIRAAAKLLVNVGAIAPDYAESMLAREKVANTWLGSGVAIPHGMVEDRNLVKHDAVSLLQVPDGVEWQNGQKARLVFAIAANSDGHIEILKKLTRLLSNPKKLEELATTRDKAVILAAFGEEEGQDEGEKADDLATSREWVLDYPSGLHARPASIWVEFAKKHGQTIRVRNGNHQADMASLAGLLQLGVKDGDTLIFSTAAEDGEKLLDDAVLMAKKITMSERESAEKSKMKPKKVYGWHPPSGAAGLSGLSASPGLAVGSIFILQNGRAEVRDDSQGLAKGAELLENALARTRQKMKALVDDVTRRIGASDAGIFKAQATLLEDDNLISSACRLMAQGHGAAWSWHQAVEEVANGLAAMDNPLLAARAVDLRDIGGRVLAEIDPVYAKGSFEGIGDGAIIIAEDLTPSDTANLDPKKVHGLVTASGGPTSHTAILARTLGIPALVAAGKQIFSAKEGGQAIIDGYNGLIYLSPTKEDIEGAENEIATLAKERDNQVAARAKPAQTTDGHVIDIAANINRPDQVPLATGQGGEGVGLMRTEFLFLESNETPDEDRQYKIYRDMLNALDGKSLIIRTLDIGGDKKVAHLHLPNEENPFLGVRGARLLLRRRDLLIPQLRAIYRAAKEGGDPWIMFPMVMSVPEVTKLKEIAGEIRQDLAAPVLKLGIMIEVPSAAIMADVFARHVDFFSIGTNDLTQYTMAVDRQNPELAAEADSLNPAVLRMVNATVKGAAAKKKWVGVCGGIAGDPFGAMLLAGLGVNELSMTPRDIPPVKARLRANSLAEMQKLGKKALQCETAEAVRALNEATS